MIYEMRPKPQAASLAKRKGGARKAKKGVGFPPVQAKQSYRIEQLNFDNI